MSPFILVPFAFGGCYLDPSFAEEARRRVREAKEFTWEFEVKWSCSVVSDSLRPHGLCSLPGSSVHGIFQVRVLEWVAISFSRGTSPPRDRSQVSRIVGRRFTFWATTWVLATGKWQRYFVNLIYLTLYGNHLISAFYLPDLFHHLISSHLSAVVYVLLVAWHSPYSEEQGGRSSRVISRGHNF